MDKMNHFVVYHLHQLGHVLNVHAYDVSFCPYVAVCFSLLVCIRTFVLESNRYSTTQCGNTQMLTTVLLHSVYSFAQ